MLFELYMDEVKNSLMQKFSYKNVMQIPKITKITINVGMGVAEKNFIDSVVNDISMISGQKPILTNARKSISNFKLRMGVPVGVKVTLRRSRMYHFMERLLYIALPRSRDFKGLKKSSVDNSGNFSFGIKENIVFPEVVYGTGKIYGMDISITTTAKNKQECIELLSKLGFPFVDR